MDRRKIINVESTSIGKTTKQNDDAIYVGENFAAVIDGVSKKSMAEVNGKKVKIADIIVEAIRKIDRPTAPDFAKTLSFDEFVQYMNMYIRKYCENSNISIEENPLEATGAIYSKYHNQIWIVGDCRAICDGNILTNDLKIDKVYANLRASIIKELLNAGYSAKELYKKDIAREIIADGSKASAYIKDESLAKKIQDYIVNTMKQTLLECGFTLEDIEERKLLEKYNDPKKLQQYLKNNKSVQEYGYSVFNGIYTPIENCVCQTLPSNVHTIKLFSDGFPVEAIGNGKDLGYAIRRIRRMANNDPLSINDNMATRVATKQSSRDEILALDDASAVNITIKHIEERDDER